MDVYERVAAVAGGEEGPALPNRLQHGPGTVYNNNNNNINHQQTLEFGLKFKNNLKFAVYKPKTAKLDTKYRNLYFLIIAKLCHEF